MTKSGTGTWDSGTLGRGTRGRRDVGLGDVETWTRGRGDAGTSGHTNFDADVKYQEPIIYEIIHTTEE